MCDTGTCYRLWTESAVTSAGEKKKGTEKEEKKKSKKNEDVYFVHKLKSNAAGGCVSRGSAREQMFALVCGERKRTVTFCGTCDLPTFFLLPPVTNNCLCK